MNKYLVAFTTLCFVVLLLGFFYTKKLIRTSHQETLATLNHLSQQKPTRAPTNILKENQKGILQSDGLKGNLRLVFWQDILDIDLSYDQAYYSLSSLTSEFPINLSLQDNTSEYQIYLDNQPILSPLQLKPFSPSDIFKLKIIHTPTKRSRTYFIYALHPQFPTFTITGGENIKCGAIYGDILYDKNSPERKKFIYKISPQGKVLFYKAHNSRIVDFKKTKIGGETYYSYLVEQNRSTDAKDIVWGSFFPTDFVVLNSQYEKIDTPKIQLHQKTYSTENHDSLILGKKHYILSGYIAENRKIPSSPNTLDSRVISSVIQEIKDNQVVWTWNSSDHPELFALSTEGNDYTNQQTKYSDYVHLNSIFVDPKDQNLILSFRHLDSVIKVERGSGKILWILGGKADQFGLTKDQKFSHQHYANLSQDGDLVIFDNGNTKKQSRIITIRLNETDKTIKDFQSYQVNGRFSPYCGNAQKLEGKTFMIGWGGGENFDIKSNASIINFADYHTQLELLFDGDFGTYRIICQ